VPHPAEVISRAAFRQSRIVKQRYLREIKILKKAPPGRGPGLQFAGFAGQTKRGLCYAKNRVL
jgi:hypothetical protein